MSEIVKFLEINSKDEFCKNGINVKEYPGEIYTISPFNSQEYENDLILQSNYTIIDSITNKILHYSFQNEQIPIESGCLENAISECDHYILTQKIEGTLIKMYFHENQWKIGTNRNPDATFAYWSSDKSFKELFHETVLWSLDIQNFKTFEDTLDINYCYSFMIQHPENNLCIKSEEPFLYYLNKVNLETFEETINDSLICKKTFSEILPKSGRGITDNYILYIYNKDLTHNRIILNSDSYENIKSVYNNTTDIGINYISNYLDLDKKEMYLELFPYFRKTFNDIDVLLEQTVTFILKMYRDIYMNKKTIDIPKKYKNIIKIVKDDYFKNREKITWDIVRDLLLEKNSANVILNIIGYK